jgi:hypothetical protein
LWTTLHLTNRFWWSKDRSYILDLYLTNVGNFTLELFIHDYPTDIEIGLSGKKGHRKRTRTTDTVLDEYHDHLATTPFPAPDIFWAIFVRHPDKLKSVVMDQYVLSWLEEIEEISQSTGFPHLEAFKVLSDEGEEPELPLFSFDDIDAHSPIAIVKTPALHTVALIGLKHRFCFPWTQILILDLGGVNADYAMRVVLECINLRTLDIYHLIDILESDADLSQTRLTLQSLETFEFSSHEVPLSWDTGLAEYLTFSSLKELCLRVRSGDFPRHAEFLRNLPPTIRFLSLFCDNTPAFTRSLFALLARLNLLYDLSLSYSDPVPIELFQYLTAKPRVQIIAPVLAQFNLTLIPPASFIGKKKLNAILRLLRSRWGMQRLEGVKEMCSFDLRLRSSEPDMRGCQWPRNFTSGVADLISKGMEVNITTLERTVALDEFVYGDGDGWD